MLSKDLVILFFIDFDIMILRLHRLIILSQNLLIILKLHHQGFILFIFFIQLLIGLLFLVELILDAL